MEPLPSPLSFLWGAVGAVVWLQMLVLIPFSVRAPELWCQVNRHPSPPPGPGAPRCASGWNRVALLCPVLCPVLQGRSKAGAEGGGEPLSASSPCGARGGIRDPLLTGWFRGCLK